MRRLSEVLRETYGEKVYKLSLSSGCTCPNRDGTLGFGGCTFCSEGGSGDFAAACAPIDAQLAEAKARIRRKTDAKRFIAYFQSYTNTYGDLDRLEALYTETLRHEEIEILSLGTRPDCLGGDVLAMLQRLNAIKPVWIELGLQTIHERTAKAVHRGYDLASFERGYHALKALGLTVIVHVIFSLPCETKEDMLDTVRYLAALDPAPDGVKLQMLHVLRGTQLGAQYETAPFPLLGLEEYAELIAESVRILPEETVIHRLTGDAPGNLLIAPEWTRNKKRVLNAIQREIQKV
ncbi:MAG: TIGR01212 family radical SAM protein [Oscillospiraceae bacterium]|nr:TIGR01212 family radical SAM protein [Oscillospiraceae bacterium]